MPKGYHHLTKEQRCQLYTLKAIGKSTDTIAEILQVHRCTLYRELRRNKGKKDYKYQQAHEKATERKKFSARNNLKMTSELIATIEGKLRLGSVP